MITVLGVPDYCLAHELQHYGREFLSGYGHVHIMFVPDSADGLQRAHPMGQLTAESKNCGIPIISDSLSNVILFVRQVRQRWTQLS